MNASAKIAAFVADAHRMELTAAERRQTFRALLDTLSVALAGRREPAVRIARAHVAADIERGGALLWGEDTTLPPDKAAWVNGIASHVLDYDDVMAPMRGHVSVALIPALLALGPQAAAAGGDFARSYAVGFEVIARLSRALASPHYGAGWHSTSALGILGAVAAGAALLRLNAGQAVNALGLAVAQASGTRQNFGTMAKSFQIGECGRAAVQSVLLARAGFDASPDALDGPAGYAALYGGGASLDQVLDGLGTGPLALLPVGIDVKKYPCCYATHLALDAILELRRMHHLTLDQVARVNVAASHRALEALDPGTPTTGLGAKFSMAYTVATALRDGVVRLSSFDKAPSRHPDLMEFLSHVAVHEVPSPVLPRWTELRVDLKDGRQLRHRAERLRGSAQDPLTDYELVEKARDCFDFGGIIASAGDFAERLFALRDQPLQPLLYSLSKKD